MKLKVINILFLTLYLAAMFRSVIPYVEYFANYDYIKEELCINKNKPVLECNGVCYLEDQLKSSNIIDTNSTQKSTVPEATLFFPVFVLNEFNFEAQKITFSEKVINNYVTNKLIINRYINEIFRPPQTV